MSAEPYKQIVVEDFCNPERQAVFTLDTPMDLLVRVEVRGGLSVRMEAGTLRVIGEAMADGEEQKRQREQ